MPSSHSLNSPTTRSPRQVDLTSGVGNNQPGRSPGIELRNGVQHNGDTSTDDRDTLLQEQKAKAKAEVASSSVTMNGGGRQTASATNDELSATAGATSNGVVQTRKRSRSGTRITRSPQAPTRSRGSNDPEGKAIFHVKLEDYVHRDLIHTAAEMHDSKENYKLQDYKAIERDQYMKLRGLNPEQVRRGLRQSKEQAERDGDHWRKEPEPHVPPLADPSAIFGPGFGQYGKFGNAANQGQRSLILLPGHRKRAGGMKTPELRVRRKELQAQAEQLDHLVPIRLDIEWDKIRLRDTFTWNLNDRVVPVDLFAQQLIEDFKLPFEWQSLAPLCHKVSASIKEQIQDYYPHVFINEEALDPRLPYHAYKDDEMRIAIKLNITIGQHTLVDQFEWDINNPLNSVEDFAKQMTTDLALPGEFTTAIAHCIREQSQLFTRSLYVTDHPFDGRPVADQELQSGLLPSPMPSAMRPYQAAKEFTPYLYELNEAELEKTELSLSREERRQKRSVNRRGGPALPDLKDRRRTIRTLVVSSVLAGAAETLEDSRIFKRAATASGKGRRSGYGVKDSLDESDDTESEDSSPDSLAVPQHLLAGTARTRGMRGAATVAQATMRSNLARSATPETSLHHHETRTSGRRFGGRDYREESVEDSSPTFIVKLRISPQRFKQFFRDQRNRNRPAPLENSGHQRGASTSEGPTQGTPASRVMGPPTTPSTQPHQQHNSPGHHREVNPLHPHAAQIGRVLANGPPGPENPIPDPPKWLGEALAKLKQSYPNDLFEGTMRYTAVSKATDLPIHSTVKPDEPGSESIRFMYYPRIRCVDCPGKLYTPGPETGVNNFEVHLKNKLHRQKVDERVAKEKGEANGN